MKFIKKPVVIEAIQWDETEETLQKLVSMGMKWGSIAHSPEGKPYALSVRTLEGSLWADLNDWIIKGVKGEFYPCKPDIFEATYEQAE